MTEFNWKVAGYAGEGIMTTGLMLSKTCSRHGLKIFDYTEYPSLIRGGHNTYQVFASEVNATCQIQKIDVLVALNKNAIENHKNDLHENSIVIYDKQDDNIDILKFKLNCKTLDLPMVKLAEDSGGKRVMANNVALGASVYILGMDLEVLFSVISDIFSAKGEDIINQNKNAASAGYNFAQEKTKSLFKFQKTVKQNLYTATGNEAVGLGAIAGGLQCYIAYPMTPSSSVLHFLAEKSKDIGFVVKHSEDEISSVNMALGASFAGVRAMVGTSGGGFCYMTEALGLSGVTELPLVVFEAMRPGPALGMPTWTAQSDLLFAINASHDEFPRIVLAPGDGQEAFELTKLAFDLSDKYQTLVIILSDKYLAESRHTIYLDNLIFENQKHNLELTPKTDASGFFPRYRLTENGISPRTYPGINNGYYMANSYEHDQYGFSTEDASIRKSQMEKRFKKVESIKNDIPDQFYLENENSKLTFISFGSTKGVIQKAVELLKYENIPTNMLHLSWLWPFPTAQVEKIINNSQNTLIVEGNFTGQLSKLITQETGIKLQNKLNKYDGRPFFSDEIVSYVKKFIIK